MVSFTENQGYIQEQQKFFNAAQPFPLDIFQSTINTIPDGVLECSCKINKHKIHANRFNLWFPNPNGPEQMNSVMRFFAEVEKRGNFQLNRNLLNQFYMPEFDWSRLRHFAFGVDIREVISESRLKIWFVLRDYPERKEKAIKLHGDNSAIRKLLFHNEIIAGFDFSFDGRNIIKLYLDIKKEELANEHIRNQLSAVLNPVSLQLLKHAHWLHIYFSDNHKGPVLQFHTTEMETFFNLLPNKEAQPFRKLCHEKNIGCSIFAFNEYELQQREIQNWSFYYMPQSTKQNLFLF